MSELVMVKPAWDQGFNPILVPIQHCFQGCFLRGGFKENLVSESRCPRSFLGWGSDPSFFNPNPPP